MTQCTELWVDRSDYRKTKIMTEAHRCHAPDPGQFRLLPDRRRPAAGAQGLYDPHHLATGPT